MSPVSRSTTAGGVYLDLQRMARATGRPTDELLRTYVLERFLWRVGHSEYQDRLIIKGGMLLAVFVERRPTADVDLLALDLANEPEAVSAMVAEILAIESDDGVTYALDQIRVTSIRDEDVYPGVRVVVPATIARARATLRVDVNVGDPVTPAPATVDYPALLDESFPVVGYPFQSVLAEKLVTMLDRGELTTRERDFATSTCSPVGSPSGRTISQRLWLRQSTTEGRLVVRCPMRSEPSGSVASPTGTHSSRPPG